MSLSGLLLGMPVLVEFDRLEDSISLCRKLGLQFIELNMNLPQCQLPQLHSQQLPELARENGIFFTLHLDERMDVCDFNESVGEAYLQTVLDAIRLAKSVNIPVLTMHLSNGVYFTLPDRKIFLYEKYREHFLSRIKQFRDLCESEIGASGIRIGVENCEGFPSFARKGIEVLLESPAFGLTWDVGHDLVAKQKDASFLSEHRGQIFHIHLHDATERTCHLTLGSGSLPLNELLATARERECLIVIEVKTAEALTDSVAWMKKLESSF